MDFDSLLAKAAALKAQKRLPEAIAVYKSAVQARPKDAQALNLLGLTLLELDDVPEAAKTFQTACESHPTMGQAHFNLGVCQERLGEPNEAVINYRKAVQIDPQVLGIWERLGIVLFELHRRAEAIQCFEHILKASPNSSRANLLMAIALEESGLSAESANLARRALELEPNSGKALSVLGFAQLNLGDFTGAKSAFEQSIAALPQQSEAYLGLVMSKKIKEEDRPLLTQILQLAASPGAPSQDRSQLHAVLGKAYDDLGEYERAIRQADEGNAIALKEMGPGPIHRDQEILEKAVPRIIRDFPSNIFKTPAPSPDSKLPLLILGLPRSGTTLLETILSSHSQIAAGGEMRYWEDVEATRPGGLNDLLEKPEEALKAGSDYLKLLLRQSKEARFVTDKSNNNGFNLGILHRLFPNAKIILCTRNGLDNAISLYMTPFREKTPTFRTRAGIVFYYEHYKRLLDHWREVLPSNTLIEVRYEDIVADQEGQTRRALEFCGLAWEDACLRHDRNVRPMDTPSLWQARQPIYNSSVERWKHYEPWLGALNALREK